jgi:hypothetical protein
VAEKSAPILGCFVVLQEEVGEITFRMEGNLSRSMKTLEKFYGSNFCKEIGRFGFWRSKEMR